MNFLQEFERLLKLQGNINKAWLKDDTFPSLRVPLSLKNETMPDFE